MGFRETYKRIMDSPGLKDPEGQRLLDREVARSYEKPQRFDVVQYYNNFRALFDKSVKKFIAGKNRQVDLPPETIDIGIPSFFANDFPRQNVIWPWWKTREQRDIRVINSQWHGEEGQKWGVTSLVLDQQDRENPNNPFDRRGIEVYWTGLAGTANDVRYWQRYNHVSVASFPDNSDGWTRTLFFIDMPEEPDDASKITGVYLVMEPTRVVTPSEEAPTRNWLSLNDVDNGVDFLSANWDEYKPSVDWTKPGGFEKLSPWDAVYSHSFHALENVVDPSPGGYGLTAGFNSGNWWETEDPAGSTDIDIELRRIWPLGPVVFPIKSNDGTWIQWGEMKKLLMHWKKERADASNEDVQEVLPNTGSTYYRFDCISTMTVTDFLNWATRDKTTLALRDKDNLGGTLEWMSFPALKRFHLVITYETKPIEDIDGWVPSILSFVTPEGKEFGGKRDTIDAVMRGLSNPDGILETIDYIRPVRYDFSNSRFSFIQNNGSVVEGGKRYSLLPSNKFDDSWLKQTPVGTQLVGSQDDDSYFYYSDGSVGDTYYGSRLMLFFPDYLEGEYTSGSTTVKVLGDWYKFDGTHTYGAAEVTINSGNDAFLYHLFSIEDGDDDYIYCANVDAVLIDGDPLPASGYICPAIRCRDKGTSGDYGTGDNERLVLAVHREDKSFFNVNAGDPVIVPQKYYEDTGYGGRPLFTIGRIWCAVDYPISVNDLATPAKMEGVYHIGIVNMDPGVYTKDYPTEIILPDTNQYYIGVLGSGIIANLPKDVTGVVVNKRAGFPSLGMARSESGFEEPPRLHGIDPLEFVSQIKRTALGIGDEIVQPLVVPVIKEDGIAILDLDKETVIDPTTDPLRAGQDFYIRLELEDGSVVPDEIRVEWLEDTATDDYIEHTTIYSIELLGRYIIAGPVSISGFWINKGVGDGLRVYPATLNGIDSLQTYEDFEILIDTLDSPIRTTCELSAYPLIQEAGEKFQARINAASTPHSNYNPDNNLYYFEVWVDFGAGFVNELTSGGLSVPNYEFTADASWVGLPIEIRARTAFRLENGLDTQLIFSDNGAYQTLSIETTPAGNSTDISGYAVGLNIVPPNFDNDTQEYTDLVSSKLGTISINQTRDVTATRNEQGGVTFTDGGTEPISVSITGISQGKWMDKDLELLREARDNGYFVYWEQKQTSEDGCTLTTYRYIGKLSSLNENYSTTELSCSWTIQVMGVRRYEL